ncbi:tetratricopeptide repeat protein [Microcoleus sp. herbarium13]|uniref:tetratricopeptide repeat protein n=1 Tax=unclassified Microcoleus TaxID=2642155 RepID=UPI003FA5D20E
MLYLFLEDFTSAVEYLKQSLNIARQIKDSPREERILINLGKAYFCLNNFAKAMECNQQHLAMFQTNVR